jgi:hypothetical protein
MDMKDSGYHDGLLFPGPRESPIFRGRGERIRAERFQFAADFKMGGVVLSLREREA